MSFSSILEETEMLRKPGLGEVEQTIAPNHQGRVKYQGTWWPARFYHPDSQTIAAPGEPVTVVGRKGIVLLVVSGYFVLENS